ncbi:V-type ATPase subunit E [Spirochaeta thermophila DSM 6578]|uniref:V-type ATPase subunit E n=1 Tax=Winmispira thermophila (strain ATCC 700085 / DSM 6578 / Z-1203) TaxID=869211 RepID=G0GEW0_WINT7|nr:ATP synthase subunit E [Spirochaeta thermophila]AEJ61516.1 V-type ATPase subunit E [Spirochaeta thermophila DSM 6578]
MESVIQELIESLKRDGVEAGEKRAQEIVRSAEIKAEQIIEKAKEQARSMREEAERAAAQFRQSAEEAIRQAGRDVILSVQRELERLFSHVLEEMAKESYSGKALEEAVVAVVNSWDKDTVGDVVLQLPEDVEEQVLSSLKRRVAEKVAAGLEIRPVKGLDRGFRIQLKDGSAYYDFTAEGIAEVLAAYLNPKVASLLKEAVK